MKSPRDWRQVRRFSLRKLSIGLVSAAIGLAIVGGASPEQLVAANQNQAQAQQGQTSVTYDYVAYEDLTAEQKAALRDSKDFPKEIAQKGTSYLLVYRQDKGLLALPETGDQSGLYSLLSGLGIFAVLLAVTKRNKKISTKVLVVTALSGAVLTAANSQALETGLRAFLTETHLVNLGQTLPQPQERIGDRVFTYYLAHISGDQAAPVAKDAEKPATETEQPVTPETPSQPEQPTLPTEPSQPEQPTLPTEPSQPEQPTLPTEPTRPVVAPVVTESLVSLPFVTEYREDPSLPLGTEVLIQAGVAGQQRLVFTDGVLTSEEILSEPQNEIIARGSYVEPPVVTAPEEPTAPSQPEQPTPTDPTAPVEPTNPTAPLDPTPTDPVVETTVVDEIIPFSTETLDAPDLPIGTSQVVQNGQAGLRQVTYINGVPVSSITIQAPVNEIIRVGSRQEPEQPTVPTEPSQPEQPTLPTEPSQPEQPTLPTEPSQPEQPTLPTEPSQPEQPTLPTEPSQPEDPTLPTEPSQPEQPTLPTEPSQPEQPTLPTEPSQPEDPTLPTEPSQPEQPTVPTEPSQPETPTLPTEPSQPEHPTLPTEPSQPEQPTLPTEPSQPEQPTLPTEPSQPEQPTLLTEPSQPEQPTLPTEPNQPEQPTLPTEPSQPEQPTVPTEPSQPEQPTLPTEPSQPEQPTLPTEPSQPEQPTLPTEPSQPEQPTLPTEPSQPEDPTLPTEPSQPEQPTLPTEPSQPEQPTLPTEPSQPEQPTLPTEPSQPEDPTLPTEPSQPEQPTLPTEPSQPEEPTLPTEPSQPEQPTLPTEPSQPEEPTLPTEPSQPEQPTLPTEPSQPEQPTLPTEPSQPEQPTLPTEPSQPEQPTLPTEPSQPEQPTKPLEGTRVVTTTVPVTTDEVDYVDSDQLYRGDTELISSAIPGEKTIETTYKTLDGELTNEVVGTPVETVTTQPTPAKVKRGTKPIEGTETETFTEPLPFDTRYEDTEDLYKGDQETVTVGKAGQKTVTLTYQTIKGVRQDNPVRDEVILSAIDEVIRRGTKPVEGTVEVKTTKVLTRDDIVYVNSPDLYEGEEEIISQAVAGEATVITTYKTIRGEKTDEVVGEPVETITTKPTPKVVKRGTKVKTEADKQAPTPIKQTVQVGDSPQAELSIDTSLLTNVASYTWKTAPDTSQVAGNVSGTVLVTYTDGSTDDVAVLVDVIKDKTKPVLTLATLTEQDDDKKITLNYDLEDPTAAYVSAKFEIFDGDRLVKSQSIDSFDAFDVAGLDWFIPYTLKTTLTYDLGNGEQSEIVSERPFELEYKRVEIKHVDRVELYEKQDDGSYRLVEELASAPADWSGYYAKVIDDKQKDTYLAIKASEETDVDGKPVFKLTATAPQLIEYTGQGTDNRKDYHFYVPKTQVYTDGKIRSFEELITAMRANPGGRYELGDDLDATKFNLASNEASYIPGNFWGRLLGNNYQIKGLTAPLFNVLNGDFEVKDLGLTEVNINMPNATNVGALAKETNGIAGMSKVTNVAVQGSIVANRFVGGLTFLGRNTTFENVSFEGDITTTNGWNINISGGLVGYLRNASSIDKAKVDATFTVDANQNPGSFHIGMVAGSVGEGGGNFTTPISNVVAEGRLINKSATEARIGGLVGSLTTTGRLSNAVSLVEVTNGQPLLGAKLTGGTPDPADTVVQLPATTDSSAIAQKEKELGITVDMANFIKPDINKYDVDYSKVAGYQAGNDLKYANTEKLLPFYNKEVIVQQANRMTSGKLATTAIVSVVPLADKEVVADFAGRKAEINKLLVHYADGSVETLDVTYKEDFRDTAIAEYSIAGTDLIYTPNQLTTNYQATVDQVQAALAGIDYYDPSLLRAMNKDTAGSSVTELMDKLYLKDSFNEVKANLGDFLKSALATSNILTIDNHDLTKYILDNKEALLLGMSYINRWYNFNFGDIKAKDLLLSFQDFNGKTSDSLEWLIGLGRSGYDALNPANNISTYSSKIAPQTGHADLMSFLSANRKALTTYETDNDWFKATSKAYIVEGKSKVLPDQDVTAFTLLSTANERNGLLPLLTSRGKTFVITNMGGITYGMYDRYYSFNNVRAAASQEEKEAIIKAMVDQASIWQRDHFDFWYRISPENVRQRLIKPMITWDGYQMPGAWLPMTGETAVNAIQDFFGPIGSRAHFGSNGSGAIANGTTIYYMFNTVLDQYGSSVFTHEAVHNNDGSIYLGGFGRRFGQRAELFATGLLQVPTNHAATGLGINTMYDYAALGYEHADNRYQALSPERFQTPADLQEFYHGTFDVLYTLDYAEAQVILNTLTSEQQSAYFNKIENYYVNDVGTGAQTHAGNAIRRFTPEEWAGLNIRTIDDLIDHNIVTHREHSVTAGQNRTELGRNGYYDDGMFSPIYAALSNSTGAPGDLMFRRIAFELMAEKGYEDGFLPYTSDKLAAIAKERGSTGTETWGGTRTVGNVNDDIVLDVVFAGKYRTWAEFKKDMFRQRIEKIGRLKPITINYKGEEKTLSSLQDIENLLKIALEEDIRRFGVDRPSPSNANNGNYGRDSRVKEVKAKIYNAYLRLTGDFNGSIYNP